MKRKFKDIKRSRRFNMAINFTKEVIRLSKYEKFSLEPLIMECCKQVDQKNTDTDDGMVLAMKREKILKILFDDDTGLNDEIVLHQDLMKDSFKEGVHTFNGKNLLSQPMPLSSWTTFLSYMKAMIVAYKTVSYTHLTLPTIYSV